jgi:hypothetical protein
MRDAIENGYDVFSRALLPYYDCMCTEGISKEVGDALYERSEGIPEDIRKRIPIYPSSTSGSVIINGDYWHSLSDWRRDWRKQHEK